MMPKGEKISIVALRKSPKIRNCFCDCEIIFVKRRKCAYTKMIKEIAIKWGTAVSIRPSKLFFIIKSSSFPAK
jgi:hypothetical protein